MSVINQMLVDLEARRAADRPAIEARQTAYTVAGVPRRVRRIPRAVVWGLVALVLAAAAIFTVHKSGYNELRSLLDRAVSSAVASTRDESGADTGAVHAGPEQNVEPAAHPDLVHFAVVPEQVAVPEPEPVTSVAVISPTPNARNGKRSVREAPAAAHSEKSVRKQAPPAQPRPEPKPAIAAEPRPKPVVAAAVSGERAAASNSAVKETHTTTAASTAQIKKVPRKPSPQALFAQHLANARNALAEGDTVTAEKRVQQALSLAPGNVAAAELLLAVQLRRGDTDAAIATLRVGLVRDPANAEYARTLARLLTARGEHQAAIDYLRAALGLGRSDGASLALLAGLERRAGDHESAAAHYVDALAQDRSVAVWWMGLGISLERLRQPAEAHAAFSEAQRIGGLDREVAAFVEQRLARLKAAAAR